MHNHLAFALLGLTACFPDPPPLSLAADGTDGSGLTTIPWAPSTPGSAGTTSSAQTGSGDVDDTVTPDDESSTLGTSTGSEDTGGSTDGGSSSSGAAAYDEPYGDCWEGPVQSSKGEYLCPPSSCVVSTPDHSACAPACDGGCEPGPDGAAATCLDALTPEVVPAICVLSCAGAGATCPATMECMQTVFEDAGGQPVWLCMWP